MSSLLYQNNNILNDFFSDGIFSYILVSTFTGNQQYFPEISNYIKTYIPHWIPIFTLNLSENSSSNLQSNPLSNRLAFNSGSLFEITFYKNLIIVIPLYVSNFNVYEDNMLKIKNWVEKYIIAENKNARLVNTINYKIIFYTYCNNHTTISVNTFKTNKTILDTNLHTYLYESLPIKIKINATPMTTTSGLYISYPSQQNTNLNTENQDKMSIS